MYEDYIKEDCIEAGLPVIDITMVPVEKCYGVAVRGPLIAIAKWELERVAEHPGCLGYATLVTVADLWRQVGGEVYNL